MGELKSWGELLLLQASIILWGYIFTRIVLLALKHSSGLQITIVNATKRGRPSGISKNLDKQSKSKAETNQLILGYQPDSGNYENFNPPPPPIKNKPLAPPSPPDVTHEV